MVELVDEVEVKLEEDREVGSIGLVCGVEVRKEVSEEGLKEKVLDEVVEVADEVIGTSDDTGSIIGTIDSEFPSARANNSTSVGVAVSN